jgi:hypothetical protein
MARKKSRQRIIDSNRRLAAAREFRKLKELARGVQENACLRGMFLSEPPPHGRDCHCEVRDALINLMNAMFNSALRRNPELSAKLDALSGREPKETESVNDLSM